MYKIALINICLNKPYWEYFPTMVESARKFLLKGHQVDFISWTDIQPNLMEEYEQFLIRTYPSYGIRPEQVKTTAKNNRDRVEAILKTVKVIPTEPFEWPLPTLYRYHLFLKEEELLKEYDYIFYCDTDMEFVSSVGDETLGDDLTIAQHPMYALDRKYIPPYEPNPESSAFIPRPGRVIQKNGKKMFEPLYVAGGFQGGRTVPFIEAMKKMKEMIDLDFTKNYTPAWNDESYWNRYIFDKSPLPPSIIVLGPSYICPDSLTKHYYQKAWGRSFVPKIITITKKHSFVPGGGIELQEQLKKM